MLIVPNITTLTVTLTIIYELGTVDSFQQEFYNQNGYFSVKICKTILDF